MFYTDLSDFSGHFLARRTQSPCENEFQKYINTKVEIVVNILE